MLLKIIRSYLKRYYEKSFRKKCNCGEKIVVSKFSEIHLSEGSKPSDIIIDSNVMFHGKIYSENNGKIKIGQYSSIRRNSSIWCVNEVEIGSNVIISDNVLITDNNNHPVEPEKRLEMIQSGWSTKQWKWSNSASNKVKINDNVWIGKDVKILKGVEIGENSIIAIGAIVTKSVPKNVIVGGNPARVIKDI